MAWIGKCASYIQRHMPVFAGLGLATTITLSMMPQTVFLQRYRKILAHTKGNDEMPLDPHTKSLIQKVVSNLFLFFAVNIVSTHLWFTVEFFCCQKHAEIVVLKVEFFFCLWINYLSTYILSYTSACTLLVETLVNYLLAGQNHQHYLYIHFYMVKYS